MDSFRSAVFAKLNGAQAVTSLLATTTSIFHRRAPLNATFPYIILDKQAGTSTWSFKGNPLANQVWMIKGVDRSASSSKAEEIDKQIDAALTDTALTLSDGTLLFLRRESDINYGEETDPDYIIHHVGGSYRVMIDRA